MSKRKMVDVKIASESFYDVLGQMTPSEVIERMKELQAGYPGRYVYFNVSSYGYNGGGLSYSQKHGCYVMSCGYDLKIFAADNIKKHFGVEE